MNEPEAPSVDHAPDNRCPADIVRIGHPIERCTRDVGHDGPCECRDGSKWPVIVTYLGVTVPLALLKAWQSEYAIWWRAGVYDAIAHYEGK